MQNMSIVEDVLGKIFKTFARWKKFYPGSDFKLTLALTLSLTLGLGLGLFPWKTIGFVNLKPNANYAYGRTIAGKIR